MPFLFALVRPLTQPTRVGRQPLVLVPSPRLKLTSFYVRISGWNRQSTDAAIESRLRARKHTEHSITERSWWTSSLRVFESCMWAYVGVDVKEKFRSAIPDDFFCHRYPRNSQRFFLAASEWDQGMWMKIGWVTISPGQENTLNLKFSLHSDLA